MIDNPVKLFSSLNKNIPQHVDVALIGSGMGSLCAAAILAKKGKSVVVFESNYLPGGCSSSYERQGYIFESGATTLVGLDKGMPLESVIKKTGIKFHYEKLDIPMIVTLKSGETITRYSEIDKWIEEAERVFGKEGQAGFWNECYSVSKLVWDASSRHLHFPPDNLKDLFKLAQSTRFSDISIVPYLNKSLNALLLKYKLKNNQKFIDFIDEQLMITAQNKHKDVNALFGAAALCYTLYGNYYVHGGLVRMVEAFTSFINDNNGVISLRNKVLEIKKDSNGGFNIETSKCKITAKNIISGIPINDIQKIYSGNLNLPKKTFEIEELCSAFQVGIVVKGIRDLKSIHHQLHHKGDFPIPGSGSLFLSYSKQNDSMRINEGERIISVSTHVSNPHLWKGDKQEVADFIIETLVNEGIFKFEDIVYSHSSGPKEWESWTGRHFGFVGGYPQKLNIKPWQMNSARIEQGLYACGDTVYPGQGIPGVALSGLIAAEKLISDSR